MNSDKIASVWDAMPDLDGYTYYVLKSSNPEILSAHVQAFIDNGWQPSGNLVAAAEGSGVAYIQAMIKK